MTYCIVGVFPARKEIIFFNMDNRLLNEEINQNFATILKNLSIMRMSIIMKRKSFGRMYLHQSIIGRNFLQLQI